MRMYGDQEKCQIKLQLKKLATGRKSTSANVTLLGLRRSRDSSCVTNQYFPIKNEKKTKLRASLTINRLLISS